MKMVKDKVCGFIVREYQRRNIIIVINMVKVGFIGVIIAVMQINKDYFEKIVGLRRHHHLDHNGLFRCWNAVTIAAVMEKDVSCSFDSAASSHLHNQLVNSTNYFDHFQCTIFHSNRCCEGYHQHYFSNSPPQSYSQKNSKGCCCCCWDSCPRNNKRSDTWTAAVVVVVTENYCC